MRAPRLTEENLAQPDRRGQGGDPPQRAEPPVRRVPLDPAAAGALRDLPQRPQRLRRLRRPREATLDDAAAFFDTYYAPANAVLTVAGDFDPDEALALIEKHFGDIPDRPAPVRPSFAEPPRPASGAATATDPHAPLPALAVGYRVPDPVNDLDGYLAHLVLAELLTDGDGSRLQRAPGPPRAAGHRHRRRRRAVGGPFDARDPDTFTITAIHPPDVDPRAGRSPPSTRSWTSSRDAAGRAGAAQVTARWAATCTRSTTGWCPARWRWLVRTALRRRVAGPPAGRPHGCGHRGAPVPAAAKSLRPDARAVLVITPAGSAGATAQ